MQFFQYAIIKRGALFNETFEIRDGVGMADGFEVMPQWFSVEGRRAPLDSVEY